MIKILFVCLGNICRSPMAEMILKEMVRKQNIQNKFLIDSMATSYEEEGNGIHFGTITKLKEENIPIENHIARRMQKDDYDKYDYIIGMEESNIRNILRIINNDSKNKVFRLLDFSDNPRDIADPWYTGNFDKTYEDIVEGCKGLLKYLKNNLEE